MPGRKPSDTEVLGYVQKLSNWGRWGPNDQLGTLNYITPEKRKRAAALVREGFSVTCARALVQELAPDVQFSNPLRHMIMTGEKWAGKKNTAEVQAATDFFGVNYHGSTVTHLDSLAHIFWDGKMYNGFPAELVSSREGAAKEDVDQARDGILTRGVLLDVTKTMGVKWLNPGEGVFPEDLGRAERALGVRVEPGDVLFLRTGTLRRRNEEGPWDMTKLGHAGFHVACCPWFHERQVALIGADCATDVHPHGYSVVSFPVHQIAIPAMGLWIMDNCNFEELAASCEKYKRWEFMVSMGPLRVVGGTGCPINPIATF